MQQPQFTLSAQFRKLSPKDRLAHINNFLSKPNKTKIDTQGLMQSSQEMTAISDNMVESCVGSMSIPIAVVSNLLINDTYYHVPIATEEPSVCAAASFGAKILGNIKASSSHSLQDAQIAIYNLSDAGEKALQDALPLLTNALMKAMQNMHKRGGGLKKLGYYKKDVGLFILHASFDTCDAMGANAVNTAMESIVPMVEEISKGSVLSAILSNFTDSRLVKAECEIPLKQISTQENTAVETAERIQQICVWARCDIRRAVTHNKGIMNGISAFALSTGNDTRALEASAHAWASVGSTYKPLSSFFYDKTKKTLRGKIELPALFASVGGSTNHPTAQWVRSVLQINQKKPLHAHNLNCIAAGLGLAQNFAALRALVTEGIQKGHMALHNKKNKNKKANE